MSALSDDERDDDESPWRFGVDDVCEDGPEPETIYPQAPEAENDGFLLLCVALSALFL